MLRFGVTTNIFEGLMVASLIGPLFPFSVGASYMALVAAQESVPTVKFLESRRESRDRYYVLVLQVSTHFDLLIIWHWLVPPALKLFSNRLGASFRVPLPRATVKLAVIGIPSLSVARFWG